MKRNSVVGYLLKKDFNNYKKSIEELFVSYKENEGFSSIYLTKTDKLLYLFRKNGKLAYFLYKLWF